MLTPQVGLVRVQFYWPWLGVQKGHGMGKLERQADAAIGCFVVLVLLAVALHFACCRWDIPDERQSN